MVVMTKELSYVLRPDSLGEGKDSGGKTGSTQVSIRGKLYQLKKSILDSFQLKRKIKAKFLDQENLGEFIAAAIARPALGVKDDDSGPELAPKVVLVPYEQDTKIAVASRYIANVGGTLNDAKLPVLTRLGPTLKQDLAEALAVSMLVGDHDVNTGNMLHFKFNGASRIAQ